MSIFVQYAPCRLRERTWDAIGESYADRVIDTLADYAPNVKGAIIHRQVLTPVDLEREFGLTNGNIFHGDMTLAQLYSLRPIRGWAQYRTPIENLYLCGSGTHPGGGVTGLPGYNAARNTKRSGAPKPSEGVGGSVYGVDPYPLYPRPYPLEQCVRRLSD